MADIQEEIKKLQKISIAKCENFQKNDVFDEETIFNIADFLYLHLRDPRVYQYSSEKLCSFVKEGIIRAVISYFETKSIHLGDRDIVESVLIYNYNTDANKISKLPDSELLLLLFKMKKDLIYQFDDNFLDGLEYQAFMNFVDSQPIDKVALVIIINILMIEYKMTVNKMTVTAIFSNLIRVNKKLQDVINNKFGDKMRLYGLNREQGWILDNPIILNDTINEYINLIRKYFYASPLTSEYSGYNQYRTYSDEHAIYLIRWLGADCFDMLTDLLNKDYSKWTKTLCFGRWTFLIKYWNAPPIAFFMSLPEANKLIQTNPQVYIIRLSTTEPGQLSVQYWDPRYNKSSATRYIIMANGQIQNPTTKHIFNDIADFDKQFRESYFKTHGIHLDKLIEEFADYSIPILN